VDSRINKTRKKKRSKSISQGDVRKGGSWERIGNSVGTGGWKMSGKPSSTVKGERGTLDR